MTQPPRDASGYDPYRTFKLRVKWDGRYVAGVSKAGALKRSTDDLSTLSTLSTRANDDPSSERRLFGAKTFEPLTLEHGVTYDAEFARWANRVWDARGGLGNEAALVDLRKDVVLEVYDEAGRLARAYELARCWASEFVAVPELDGQCNAVRIETLTLENEGWQRNHDAAANGDRG